MTAEEEVLYRQFLETHPRGHILQSPEWARVKDNWINEVVLSKDEQGAIRGACSVLIRRLPGVPFTLMYAPRGPVCDLHDEAVLSDLTEQLRAIGKQYKAIELKLDTDAPADDLEYAKIMAKLGYKLNNGYTNLEGVQARFVFRVNIKGKTPDEVMAGFHSKTRYNIRLAQRHGVEIRVGTREDIPAFFELMKQTGERDGFVIRGLDYFYRMYDCLGEDHHRLFLAYYEGKPVAGAVAGAYGNKCLYLYGASGNESRKHMPAYLVQWAMIQWAMEKGCEIYDLRGVPGVIEDENNPIYGLYRFKKGFGGDLVEFIGEFDLLFHPVLYRLFTWAEHIRKTLRKRISQMRRGGRH